MSTGLHGVDSMDLVGRNPLSWAAEYQKEVIVKLLIETCKVEVDSKDKDGRTRLWWAVDRCYNEAVVKLLLRLGKANIYSYDNSGRSPLTLAH